MLPAPLLGLGWEGEEEESPWSKMGQQTPQKAVTLERYYSGTVLSTEIWTWPEQGLNPRFIAPWSSHFTPLSRSDLLGKMGMNLPTQQELDKW